MKNRRRQIIAFVFLGMLFLPILFLNRVPNKVSELERRNLSPFPVIYTNEGKLSPGVRSAFETWLNDNIGFRDFLVKIYGSINYKLLGRSPNNAVELGRDGWMYYTRDRNLEIASGEYFLSPKELEAILKQQLRIDDKLKKQGIEYVLILPTSKVSVYPEFIRSGEYSIRETPVEQLAKYIQAHSDICVIPLKKALVDAKKEGKVFFKTDTHWTEFGAYMGYCEIVRRLNEFGLLSDEPKEVTFKPFEYQGEMGGLMGNAGLVPPEKTEKSVIISKSAQKIELDSSRGASLQNILEKYQVKDPCYLYENNRNYNTLLMFGDSMFGGWNITELLAEHFNQVAYVFNGEIQQEYIDLLNPEIVIYEITERYLDQLADRNRNFSYRLRDFQAEIVSNDAPSTVERERSYRINITVENTSYDSWSEEQGVRMCVWQDGQDRGYRQQLPDGVEIAPGEQYTFCIDNFVVPLGSSTYLEFQMCQEGIAYFGEKERVDIRVISQ